MTGIDSWSTTPATNATADGGAINWAEGQPPSSVNNSSRQMLADERSRQNDLIWFNYGTGDQGAGNLAVPSVYLSGISFTITGADVTTVYHANRRVRAVGVSTGTIYGTISSSSYNGGNTKTTVIVAWDSGSLSNETLVISLSQIPYTGSPAPNVAVNPLQIGGAYTARQDSFINASGANNVTVSAGMTGELTFISKQVSNGTQAAKYAYQVTTGGVLTITSDLWGGLGGTAVVSSVTANSGPPSVIILTCVSANTTVNYLITKMTI